MTQFGLALLRNLLARSTVFRRKVLQLWESIPHRREGGAQPSEYPGAVLRLPKVYGPEENADLATVYGFRRQPQWRWTHDYVENVAKPIALAVCDPRGANSVFNVAEAHTPTMAERLGRLPDRDVPLAAENGKNFAQDIAYDTSKIRGELGFIEEIDEIDALYTSRAEATPIGQARHKTTNRNSL